MSKTGESPVKFESMEMALTESGVPEALTQALVDNWPSKFPMARQVLQFAASNNALILEQATVICDTKQKLEQMEEFIKTSNNFVPKEECERLKNELEAFKLQTASLMGGSQSLEDDENVPELEKRIDALEAEKQKLISIHKEFVESYRAAQFETQGENLQILERNVAVQMEQLEAKNGEIKALQGKTSELELEKAHFEWLKNEAIGILLKINHGLNKENETLKSRKRGKNWSQIGTQTEGYSEIVAEAHFQEAIDLTTDELILGTKALDDKFGSNSLELTRRLLAIKTEIAKRCDAVKKPLSQHAIPKEMTFLEELLKKVGDLLKGSLDEEPLDKRKRARLMATKTKTLSMEQICGRRGNKLSK